MVLSVTTDFKTWNNESGDFLIPQLSKTLLKYKNDKNLHNFLKWRVILKETLSVGKSRKATQKCIVLPI